MANALVNGVNTERDRRSRAVAAIVAAFRRRVLRLSTQEGAINALVSEAIAATAKAQQGAAALFLWGLAPKIDNKTMCWRENKQLSAAPASRRLGRAGLEAPPLRGQKILSF